MRVAATELRNNENYAPFEGLATEGKATVVITMNDSYDLTFGKSEKQEPKPPATEEEEPLIKPIKVKPRTSVV